ncbi:hypothetical protein MPTK1_3g12030 [Marchantia polymorpha subsp. ruderalis]|uniref:TANGO6 HEAT repeat domain-containing protein n=2 Tax=Marchantia polymorpha TaxID=3197 RepID=A0A176W4E4_MARPO|nr:hypothetical protein AXG93_2817s1400 [Marchantia polymorpha subsp. ruderalis]PTQ38527.1 hypothetical protein MARPO_0050s0007 [Marchantia polymorpha]PTQ38528.1 hypothetical protein MARPO_0050s0007 [Marchantia polymorpha]BBN05307.1 hypothetical protein Mp_3g12030 [Marchantia polymorpha subsp. ruderalis]BBN05308.1 hypothetical protein Mp_3g12030 [Marchantia polymorpha subsp. ruderalis]|eukprot:PTQ38527.1 hypothetical protein MARPO_0050s0007 [Marchantia polymorpha]
MTLETEKKSSRPVKAVLKDARSVLSSVADSPQNWAQGVDAPAADTGPIARSGNFVLHCAELVREFHRLLVTGTNFEFKEWTVVKAVTELVVRWGIYPYLSPGVGIPLQKRFGNKAASAAANAVSDYVRASQPVDASFEGQLAGENSNAHPLIFSADLLSFIVLEKIFIVPSDSSLKGNAGTGGDESNVCKTVAGTDEDEEKYEGKYTPAVDSSPGALRQLILTHHLIDILAALLQIAHDEHLGPKSWKEEAVERIKAILDRLPVDYVVEALFGLLGQNSSATPPPWLKPEVGKLLSQVVMRTGGLSTVMERLVGGAESGSVQVYDRVAAHLAKVPRHVSTADAYYKAVCTELRMLLFLPDISYIDKNTTKAHKNMHHTSVALACILAHQEPFLTEKYLLGPVVEPLLGWSELESRTQSIVVEGERKVERGGSSSRAEHDVLDGLHVLKLLLTAGHDKSSRLRQQLVKLTLPLVPKLILLKYLIWPSYGKHVERKFKARNSVVAHSKTTRAAENMETFPPKRDQKAGQRKDFQVGFLNGIRLYDLEDDEERTEGTVGHLMGCISDIVDCHLSQAAVHVVPIVFTFLFDLRTTSISWPASEGEIAGALEAGKRQVDSSAIFFSKLLLAGEYWELTVSLLVDLLRRALSLRKAARIRSTASSPDQSMEPNVDAEAVLRIVQTLEVLYVEVGIEAVERDATGALPLLKILLDDEELLNDREMLELVLQLVHSAFSQLHQDHKRVEDDANVPVPKSAEQVGLLKSIGISLQKITVSSKVSKESQDFAASLRSALALHLTSEHLEQLR